MSVLRSGQVARAAGVNRQTLRYYEHRGLLAEPDRTIGGQRLYPGETVTILRVIKAAQRLGFSLDEVAELLQACGHPYRTRGPAGPGADAGLGRRAAVKLAEVEARIAELTAIADTLRSVLDAGCSDLIECADQPGCPVPFAGRQSRPVPLAGRQSRPVPSAGRQSRPVPFAGPSPA